MSPLDAVPHVLIVYVTPGEDDEPQHRWESPGIQSVTRFDTRGEAESIGRLLSSYTRVEYDVVKLDYPVDPTTGKTVVPHDDVVSLGDARRVHAEVTEPTSILAQAIALAQAVVRDDVDPSLKDMAQAFLVLVR